MYEADNGLLFGTELEAREESFADFIAALECADDLAQAVIDNADEMIARLTALKALKK